MVRFLPPWRKVAPPEPEPEPGSLVWDLLDMDMAGLLQTGTLIFLLKVAVATCVVAFGPAVFLPYVPAKRVDVNNHAGAGSFDGRTQRLLLAFAGGGLVADAALHAMPHLFPVSEDHHSGHGSHGHGHGNGPDDPMVSCWLIALGFGLVFAVDRFSSIFNVGGSDKAVRREGLERSAAEVELVEPKAPVTTVAESAGAGTAVSEAAKEVCEGAQPTGKEPIPAKGLTDIQGEDRVGSDSHNHVSNNTDHSIGHHHDHDLGPAEAGIYPTLAVDLMHNVLDGFGIGAAYAMGGEMAGHMTALLKLVHEIQHEVGDVTTLVQNGMSKHHAIHIQHTTAAGVFVGLAMGLATSAMGQVPTRLLAVTAGATFHLAAGIVLRPVLAIPSSVGGLAQPALEVAALAMGGGFILAVGEVEKQAAGWMMKG